MLCNELGAESSNQPAGAVESSGRTQISVKEAVQIARDNNFMGLICSSRLLVSTREWRPHTTLSMVSTFD
jgi:CDK inhibitor PHO81